VQVRPVRVTSIRLIEEVHDRIRELIVTGRLAPDERLNQVKLADALGVSRTPVREALLRLEREGLVYTRGGHGMFVRAVRREDVVDIYEARLAIEPVAARLGCERATPRQVAAVERIQRAHERDYPLDVAAAFRSNRDLHMAMVAPCGNSLLLRFIENVWDHNSALRIFAFYSEAPERVADMVAEHRILVDHYAARDALGVEELIRAHIAAAREQLEKDIERTLAAGGAASGGGRRRR
jgi:DNA-binding GntR family transcriptional regulator